jgi:hypothetical protein
MAHVQPTATTTRPLSALPAPDGSERQADLVPRPSSSLASLRAGARPRAIVPRTLDEAMAFARAVVAARMAPSGFETPEACMIAILHGMEVGLTPLSALQRIAVIGGRPTIWGDGAMALVRASGLAASIEERIEGTGPTDWVGVCTVRRRGDVHPVERRFSADDARRARLWGKAGPWSDYPQRMLQMRARAFALRDVFADVLGGLYLREELEGIEENPETMEADVARAIEGAGAGPSAEERADAVDERSPSTHSPIARPASRPKIIAPPPPPMQPVQPEQPMPPSPDAPPLEPAWPASPAAAAAAHPYQPDNPPINRAEPTRPRAALTARRRTSGAREAQRLRFENGWAIRRPRTLQVRPSALPARRRPKESMASNTAARDTTKAAAHSSTSSSTPEHEDTPTPSPSPHAVLGLYDDALSCALDEATLAEIVEEYLPRLTTLDRDAAAQAERILARHRDRVAVLAMLDADGSRHPDIGGQP